MGTYGELQTILILQERIYIELITGNRPCNYESQIGPIAIEINAVKKDHEEYTSGQEFAHLDSHFRFSMQNGDLYLQKSNMEDLLPEIDEIPIIVLFKQKIHRLMSTYSGPRLYAHMTWRRFTLTILVWIGAQTSVNGM